MKQLFYTHLFLFIALLTVNQSFAQEDALFIDKSGNVGIGTSTPQQNFSVNGGMNIDQAANNNGTFTSASSAIQNVLSFGAASGEGIASNRKSVNENQYGLDFYTAFAKRMSISNSGNVGIGTTVPSSQLEVKGRIKDETGYVMPKGGIIMWSGSPDDFDNNGKAKAGTDIEGWAICNGKNGTPNLEDKFIVSSGNSYKVNNTGGQDWQTLSVEQMPAHNHRFNSSSWFNFGLANDSWDDGSGRKVICENGHQGDPNSVIESKGGGRAFDNRPSYYTLIFIMKL